MVEIKYIYQWEVNLTSSFTTTSEPLTPIRRGEGAQYIVDLSATEYLDSSALGMLLLLREHAGGESSNIRISKASPEVKKILDVANFEKLFNI